MKYETFKNLTQTAVECSFVDEDHFDEVCKQNNSISLENGWLSKEGISASIYCDVESFYWDLITEEVWEKFLTAETFPMLLVKNPHDGIEQIWTKSPGILTFNYGIDEYPIFGMALYSYEIRISSWNGSILALTDSDKVNHMELKKGSGAFTVELWKDELKLCEYTHECISTDNIKLTWNEDYFYFILNGKIKSIYARFDRSTVLGNTSSDDFV